MWNIMTTYQKNPFFVAFCCGGKILHHQANGGEILVEQWEFYHRFQYLLISTGEGFRNHPQFCYAYSHMDQLQVVS